MNKVNCYFGNSIVSLIGVAVLVMVVYNVVWAGMSAPAADMSAEAVAARIAPVGMLNTGAPIQAEAPKVAAAAGPRAGDEIFNSTCMACHATGAAGAPKVGDKAAWAPRIDQGLATLLKHAISGKGAMPPRGTCANCSDDELKGAIEYMVSKSK